MGSIKTIAILLLQLELCFGGLPFDIPFLSDAEWLNDIGGMFGFGSPRGPAQLTPCECINPWLPLNGSDLYEPNVLCGPEGEYPVCYVRCNADCGDVTPAQDPIRCQSKMACEQHRQQMLDDDYLDEPSKRSNIPEGSDGEDLTTESFQEESRNSDDNTTEKPMQVEPMSTKPMPEEPMTTTAKNSMEDTADKDPDQCRLLSNCSLPKVAEICPMKCKRETVERMRVLSQELGIRVTHQNYELFRNF